MNCITTLQNKPPIVINSSDDEKEYHIQVGSSIIIMAKVKVHISYWNECHKDDEDESRRIQEEQDRVYAESLAAGDQVKEDAKVHIVYTPSGKE